MMATATETTTRSGVLIIGEFLSVSPGRKWTGRDGLEREPFNVKLLVNDSAVSVEYRDAESAEDALREATGGEIPDRQQTISLPVFARAKGKDWLQYSGVNRRSGQ